MSGGKVSDTSGKTQKTLDAHYGTRGTNSRNSRILSGDVFATGGLTLSKAVRWEHDYVRIESRAEFRLGLFCHGTGHQLATPG